MARKSIDRSRYVRAIFASVLSATLLLVAACSSSGNATPQSGGKGNNSGSGGKPVKIGMILEAQPNIDPWSAAWQASIDNVVAKDSGVSYKEAYNANTPTDAQPVIQQLLGSGYGVMLLTSYTLSDVAKGLHAQYSKVPMAVSAFTGLSQPNLNIMSASYLQMGYVNCWMLAKLSKTHTVGYINGMPVPFATEILQGCKLGATAADPSTRVLTAYTNSFSDQQKAVIQAQSLKSQGADVLWPASGETDALGVYRYCEQNSIPCAGWGGSLKDWAPNSGVINATLDWTNFIEGLVAQYRSGNLNASIYDATYANHGIKAEITPGAQKKFVTPAIKSQFDAMLADIEAGKVKFPPSAAHPGQP